MKIDLPIRSAKWLALLIMGITCTWQARAQEEIQLEDIRLECGAAIPDPDVEGIVDYLPACLDDLTEENEADFCGDRPITEEEGCVVALDECLQVALICITGPEDQPVYTFRIFNACDKDLSNISFQIPQWGQVAVPEDLFDDEFEKVEERNSVFTTCSHSFQVEGPRPSDNNNPFRDPDGNSYVKFEGKLEPWQSAFFTFQVLEGDPLESLIVAPKLGTNVYRIELDLEDCYTYGLVEDVDVETKTVEEGCSGTTIQHIYTVYFADGSAPLTLVRNIIIAADEEAPTGACPSGKDGLSGYAEMPSDEKLMWYFKENWTDNCGSIHVKKVDEKRSAGDCGEWTVTKKFVISDDCRNKEVCEVTYSGAGEAESLVGTCPEVFTGYQCPDEVPSNAEVIAMMKDRFENEVNVQIWTKKFDGDACSFVVKYKVMITGECGDQEVCWVTYKGGDNTAPELKSGYSCPAGEDNLSDYSAAPHPSQYLWKIKNAYEDNCGGDLWVKYIDKVLEEGECGAFTLTYKYMVKDICGNATWCYVTHSGSSGTGALTGSCPSGANDLQCLAEVPSKQEVIALVKESFNNEASVQIWSKNVNGDQCDGFVVKYKVMVTDYCGDSQVCWVTFKGKDTEAPTGTCPPDKSGLSDLSEVPSDNTYMWYFKENWSDNCSDIHVEKVDEHVTDDGPCGAFKVVKKFAISDACGNTRYCSISHTGEKGGYELTGHCPEGADDLQCLEEVPGHEDVIALVKESYKHEKNVQIWSKTVNGDECDGFVVKYKVMVTGYCGESKVCWVTFKGKDTEAPTGVCPEGLSGLTSYSEVPHPSAYKWKIKNAYTDNCSESVDVVHVKTEKHEGDCGEFKVVQKYKVLDECGNYTWCKVVHEGGEGGEELIGSCPADVTGLQCIDEVPGNAEVVAMFHEAFENESTVAIWTKTIDGNDCDGFTVKFKVMITDYCYNSQVCWITFSGKDETAPVFTGELPSLTIGCEEEFTFDTPEAFDNCGGKVAIRRLGNDQIIEGDCEAAYSLVRTWIAMDECGNLSEPVSQVISRSGDCCQGSVCAYTPFYWGQNSDSGTPNVQEVLEANGGTILVGPYELDKSCIDVVLPGAPLATPENMAATCPDGLYSSSLVRHTIALTLNTLNDPALCEVSLSDLPCPIDLDFFGYDENATVCDLLADANEAIEEEWYDCELADALAAVNECFDCGVCVPDDEASEEEEGRDRYSLKEGGNSGDQAIVRPQESLRGSAGHLQLEVFPNPSAGLVNVQFEGFEGDRVWIFLHNLSGDLVKKFRTQEGGAAQVSMDMGALRLPGGTYIVTASSGKKTASKKLVVNYKR